MFKHYFTSLLFFFVPDTDASVSPTTPSDSGNGGYRRVRSAQRADRTGEGNRSGSGLRPGATAERAAAYSTSNRVAVAGIQTAQSATSFEAMSSGCPRRLPTRGWYPNRPPHAKRRHRRAA
jgi:hypothetical protein